MADVKFDKLKLNANAMFTQATKADERVKNLETWAGKEVEKTIWTSIKEQVQKALESSGKLKKFADDKKQDGADQAGKDFTAALDAAHEAVKLATPLKAKAQAGSTDSDELVALLSALGRVTAQEKAARDALGLPEKQPASADTTLKPPEPKPADPKPADSTSTETRNSLTPSAAIQQAVDAAAEALRQAGEAETQANAIEKADNAKVKEIADKVLVAAKAVKAKAADAKKYAEQAKTEAKDSEKQTWDDAAKAAEAVAKPAGDLETAAAAVTGKTKPEEIKAQAKDSKLPDAATAAKTAADAAKKKADAAKGAAPAGAQPGTQSSETKPGTTTSTAQKKEEKKVPNSFGASITASYSRKFSLDTTVHSKVEVTMVPYPPPQQFLDWIRAHYNKEHPSGTPKP